ncbi:MAG: lasso peptide biosynthesis PqqD family chaperone [Rhodocyclaceae bacterium]|nr:lasso peptide biosynthesis PqqD family chaperone [Rhodocyclaceae bacterium]
MPDISHTLAVVRNPDLVATDMDGETVMMSVERGEYYGLKGVGSRVWELLAQPASVTDLAQTICAEYAIDEPACRADLADFIDDLLKNGLVRAA